MYLVRPKNVHIKEWRIFIMDFGMSMPRAAEDMMQAVLIISVIGTILALIFVTPERKRTELTGFMRVLHDIFNFNGLIIEVILKALYIFMTIFIILTGLFAMFEGAEFMQCLLIMVGGPIVIRIYFELIMMLVLLVKNVTSINKKMKDQNAKNVDNNVDTKSSQYVAKEETPLKEASLEKEVSACCPHCGVAIPENITFCPNCGQSVQ